MDTPPVSDPVAQYQQALALHEAGRLDEAAVAYRAMLAQFPGNPLLIAGLGTIALQQGELDEGVRQLEAAFAEICRRQRARTTPASFGL